MKFKVVASVGFLFVAQACMAAEVGKIAAVVNEQIISQTDLEGRVTLAIVSSGMNNVPSVRAQLRPQILQTMIDELLQIERAKEFEIEANQAAIGQAIQEIEHRNQMGEGTLKRTLAQHNVPLSLLETQLKAQLSWAEYIQGRYQQMVQINDAELARAADQFSQKKEKAQRLLAEILLTTDGPGGEGEALRKARTFVADIRKGASFMSLAQQFSKSASAARGGDIGWVAEGQLEAPLEAALAGMSVGQVSEPIQTQAGYVVLMLRDKRAAGESLGKETLISFAQTLFIVEKPFTQANVEAAMAKAGSIAGAAKSCGMIASLVKGHAGVKTRMVEKVRLNEMPPQLQKLLVSLTPNQTTQPILSDDGVLLFTLCSREEVNPDNPSEDQMRGMLLGKKLDQVALREMREMRRTAHIDVRI